jgi:uncharacterized protein (TIGR03083 family)
MTRQLAPPIQVVHLFPEMRAELLRILAALTEAEWSAETACAGWTVKDVALHLLGDDVSVLSRLRDGFSQRSDFESWADLVGWINERNDLWVRAARRTSTPLLIELLRFTGGQLSDYMASISQEGVGVPVSWAGSGAAPVWLNTAREYTEYWMHHQHICDGVGVTSLKEHRYALPLIDTFLRALPHHYRDVQPQKTTVIEVRIMGIHARWLVVFEAGQWQLYSQIDLLTDCIVTLPFETAWRLFTKGMTPEAARQTVQIEGDAALAEPLLHMVSIIA